MGDLFALAFCEDKISSRFFWCALSLYSKRVSKENIIDLDDGFENS